MALPNTRNIKSILVIKMRNIGDVLLTTPVFTNLREYYPGARICALVNSGTEEMLTDNPVIDQVYVYERSIKAAPFIGRIANELLFLNKIRAEHFDMVINLTDGDRGALVVFTSGAHRKFGVKSNGRGFLGKDKIFNIVVPHPPEGTHTVDQNLELLDAAGVPIFQKRVSFYFPGSIQAVVLKRLYDIGLIQGGYFHAHVTSRWMFKTMPPATAARLLDLLAERAGFPCLLTSSPDPKERDYLNELQRHMNTPIPHFSDLRLKELGALTSMARFFAGVDSAPMHIAAALNVPVLAVFGPSSAQNWGPWNNDLDHNPYTVERGIQISGKHVVLQSGMECVPCHRDGCNGSKVSNCLDFDQETLEKTVSLFIENIEQNIA